jgi:DNA polymerase-3 subunit delta
MATNGKAITVLAGTDEWAIKQAALQWTREHAPEDEMNFEIIDAQVDRVEQALEKIAALREAILTLPFMGGAKLVWWKNVNFLDDSVLGRSESVLEALEALRPDLERVEALSVQVVMSVIGLDKRRTFAKALTKLGEVKYLDLPDFGRGGEEEAIAQIEAKIRSAGLTPGPSVGERLWQMMGYEPRALLGEIEKLSLHHGSGAGPVTLEEVQAVCSSSREVVVWDFCDAVIGGNARSGLVLLHQLLAQEESEVGILILLANQTRQAALATTLMEHRLMRLTTKGTFVNAELTPEGAALLPKKKTGEPISTFMLAKVGAKAKRQPARFWRRAVAVVHQANRDLVTSAGDKRRVLENVVLTLAG